MIVMKFGGTSVQDAAAMTRSMQAVIDRLDRRPVVVLSATAKTTSRLLEIAEKAHRGELEAAGELREIIAEHHLRIARDLLSGKLLQQAEESLGRLFQEIADVTQGLALLGECTGRSKDKLASLGERMSSLILAHAFQERGHPARLLDSRELVRTDDDFTRAVVDEGVSFPLIRRKVKPLVREGKIPVLQGFIGSTAEGVTTTIGRGGSDLSASLIGAALEAGDIQIWTDVPGILTTDPRLVSPVFKVKAISFAEASELAYFGAKVLHPSTLLPAVSRGIPVHVCDSSRSHQTGTRIAAEAVPSTTPLKAIACKPGITLLNVHSTRMLLAHGFLHRIFEVFERHRAVVDAVATSEVSVSLTLDSAEKLPQLIADLKRFSQVDVESDLAIVCVVGDDLRSSPGIAGRVFSCLDTVNIRMISQGASRINITFLVREERLREAVSRLHAEFFADPDPEVFECID